MKYIKTLLMISVLLAAFFPACLNTPVFATKTHVSNREDLKPYNISFLIKADLNNDGKEEKVTIYRQWDGEGWWSDDQWYIICIFDKNNNMLYKRDISYFQAVEKFSVKDRDGDGLKEIIILLEQTQC